MFKEYAKKYWTLRWNDHSWMTILQVHAIAVSKQQFGSQSNAMVNRYAKQGVVGIYSDVT